MDTEPIEPLMNKIMDRYNRKPEGWKVLTDLKGNVLILGPKVGYRLKLVPLNPQDYTGVGVTMGETRGVRRAMENVPSYGFRPLSGKETKLLFSTFHLKGTIQNRLIKKLLGVKPVPTWQLQSNKPRAILTGPVITHPNLGTISKSQCRLEKKLTTEAYKLFRKRYPGRAAMYR